MNLTCHSLPQLRAGFVAKGTSLHAWCKENDVDYANLRKALDGRWTGAKAQALVERVAAASLAAA